MGEPQFSVIDRHSPQATLARVAELIGNELGGARSYEEILRVIDFDHRDTRIVGVMVDNQLVSINAFMPLTFCRGANRLVGLQSGFSATDAQHRGKGHWPRLMKYVETYYAEQGAAFIFGFPNPVSHPLFVKKLGYRDLSIYNFRIPRFGPLMLPARLPGKTQRDTALRPDMDDNRSWKERASGGGQLTRVDTKAGRLWGKVRRRSKFGRALDFLDVGGFELVEGGTVRSLFADATREAKVAFLYLSINRENEYFPLVRGGKYGQPLILKPLGTFDPDAGPANFFGGMRDTY